MTRLANGDFSTSVFSRSILATRNRHQISLLMDDDGQVYTDPQVVEDKIIKFYETLFSSKGPLSEDLVHGYHKENGVPKAAIKFDLAKA
ncbi:hypothetical protein LIER_28144 [Lithospermum erythrorhizon]|uniref:Uncharacterized protein n=1 Tax=Lithospermum erythrorhizon TaxID=34254 RepID=A0AAV3RG70_LITER